MVVIACKKIPDFFVSIAKQCKDKDIDFKWIGDINNAELCDRLDFKRRSF